MLRPVHLCVAAVVVAIALVAMVAGSETAHEFSYQGYLTGSDGNPVPNAAYEFIFTLYPDEFGTTALWGDTQYVSTDDGYFLALLGRNNPIPIDVFSGVEPARYLEITVGGETISPRTYLGGQPYSDISKVVKGDSLTLDADGLTFLGTAGETLFVADASGNVEASTVQADGSVVSGDVDAKGDQIVLDGPVQTITATSGTINFDDENLVTTGNVGIGTTDPQSELEVQGSIYIDPGTGQGCGVRIAEDDVIKWALLFRPWANHSLSIYDDMVNDFVMHFDSGTGQVGIGTEDPQAKLHVNGGVKLGTDIRGFEIKEVLGYESDGWSAYIEYGGIAIGSEDGGNRQMFMFTDGANHHNIFTVATSENSGSTWEADFVIEQDGDVGIGVLNPTASLEVEGTVAATAFVGDGSGLTNIPGSGGGEGGWTDDGNVVRLSSVSDKVGIGTTSPVTKLDVNCPDAIAVSGIGSPVGVQGKSTDLSGVGQLGVANNGVWGYATNGVGVKGVAGAGGGVGVRGEAPIGDGVGVSAMGGPDGLSGLFEGDVRIKSRSSEENIAQFGHYIASGHVAVFYGNVLIKDRVSGDDIVELGEGLDYAEGFDVSGEKEIEPGMVVVIDPDNPGQLRLSDRSYDSKVAGIVAGARGLGSGVRLGVGQFDHDVALAGRVYCNVKAGPEGIVPGDLLTTSDVAGFAMKAADRLRSQGSILGKAMESLSPDGAGKILVLVTLQ